MANLIAVLVARDTALGFDARRSGVAANAEAADGLCIAGGPWILAPGAGYLRPGKRRAAAGSGGFAAADQSGGARAHD